MNLDALKAAVRPLTKFGQDELTFTVPDENGQEIQVTLRPLLPAEEIKCQRYAKNLLEGALEEEGLTDSDTLSRTAALHYMDQFRTEIIAHAIIQVGSLNLRGVKYIETGDRTESGAQVKIPKEVALRQIITDGQEGWSRGMITIVFSKYGDLITKISEKADKVAKESIADIQAELDRARRYVRSIEEELERRAKGDPSVTAQQIKALVNAGAAMEAEVDQAIQQARDDRRTADALEAAAQVSDEDIENEPMPPMETAAPAETPAPAEPARPPRQPVIPPTAPPPTPPPAAAPPQFRSSFDDLESPDSQAIENDRLLAAQRAAAKESRQALSEDDAMSAVSRAEQVGFMTGPDGRPLLDKDGQPVPAFKLPSETISARGRQQQGQPQKKTVLDPDPSAGSRNPNFKPPGGGR